MPTKRRTISRSPPPNTLPHPFYLWEKKWQSSEFFQSLFAALKVAFFQLVFLSCCQNTFSRLPESPCKCLPGIPFGLCSFSIILGPVRNLPKNYFWSRWNEWIVGQFKTTFSLLKILQRSSRKREKERWQC